MRRWNEFNLSHRKQLQMNLRRYIVGDDKSLFYLWGWSLVHLTWGIYIGVGVLIYLNAIGSLTLPRYLLECLIIHSIWELLQMAIEITPYWKLRGWIDTGVDSAIFMGAAMLPFIATNHG
jgi:hypothetical protein